MKVEKKRSAFVIDRRKAGIAGILAAIAVAIAAVAGRATAPDREAPLIDVVSTSLDRGQQFWAARVRGYRYAHVVLYRGSIPTACGRGLAASGPFYCPGDERIYIDLGFLAAIDNDLARSYVIAHELGHHVQKLRGELAGRDSIAVELGADCYAGAWIAAEHRADRLHAGDVEAALATTASIGDDKLCPACSPESWSHGSSNQRTAAVRSGIAGGACAL